MKHLCLLSSDTTDEDSGLELTIILVDPLKRFPREEVAMSLEARAMFLVCYCLWNKILDLLSLRLKEKCADGACFFSE